MEALQVIAVAPVPSALLLPIAYVFALVSVYEQLFVRLAIGPTKQASVVRFAKRKLMRYLGLHPAVVQAFTGQHGGALTRATTKTGVDTLLKSAVMNS
jgi:hypothetical protein